MTKELTREQRQKMFIEIGMGGHEYSARFDDLVKILKKYNLSMTLYTTTPELIDRLLSANADEFEKLIPKIKLANEEERFLDLFIDIKERESADDRLNKFFNHFEKPSKERLFLLIGETGVGKSYSVEKRFPDIVQYACDGMLDPYRLMWELTNKGEGLEPVATPFNIAMQKGGLVMLDEINELPLDTLMFLQGITDEKKSVVVGDKHINIHPNFKILGTLNPPSETDERKPLGDALLGRAVGYVMKLTDDLIAKRLDITKEFINSVRKLHSYIKYSGLEDVRELNYRDFQKIVKYGIYNHIEFIASMGHVKNIADFGKIEETEEFQKLITEVEKNAR